MKVRMTRRGLIAAAALGALLTTAACGVESEDTTPTAGASCAAPKALKVGWSTIFLAPSWMQDAR
ncbi:hypothetical protein K1W54_06535 [Micromonospora sp. CPCC 205371]|nr:hypothetical protein [Micromonospora sp. CPCC 205371]